MSYLSEWKAISIRIKSYIDTLNALSPLLQVNSGDSFNSKGSMGDQFKVIYSEIDQYAKKFENTMQPQIKEEIETFLSKYQNHFKTDKTRIAHVQIQLAALASIESSVTFLLSDVKEQVRRNTELAFIHLQRSIMADPEIKVKWKDAFGAGEVACEKLGSLHLLQHGIWAFKAHADGGRTDLILGETINSFDEIERTAIGLVLTEWKVAKKDTEIGRMFQTAKKQAQNYASGVLAGIELENYRYLVVVSEHGDKSTSDLVIENNCTYRHINIAVDPLVPSKDNVKGSNLRLTVAGDSEIFTSCSGC